SKSVIVPIGDMPPLSSQKVAFSFLSPKFNEPGTKKLFLRLNQQNERTPMDVSQEFDISVKNLWDLHKRTFISRVDNSVQYYAVRPPFKNDVSSADALILSVHGAGVEATGQAAAYGAKSWAWIVAATNRRPFGFDWEDWGTIDAMEVLADAKARYKPREDRIYLTGHSMGGHGAWYLGATFPDQWGAVAPCAGWINFWQYGGGVKYDNPDPIESLLLRVANPSDPLKIIHNYADFGVYTVNGQSDDTVPIEQARTMRKLLSEFHHDVDFFEQPGAGHWYDVDPAPGADSVDYAPMMEFLDRHRRRLPKEARRVEFWTTCPQVSAKSHWVTVLQQEQQFAPSSVVAINPTGTQTFEVTTTNIAALKIDVADSPVPDAAANVTIKLDGTEIDAAQSPDGSLTFMKSATGWVLSNALDAREKNPERGGPFKHAFDNGFVLVYGTTGTPEENAWSYAKARYDAESWWYRGNGRAQIVPDTSVQQGPSLNSKNYILYGSEDTNSAIKFFCEKSPVHVTRESIKVGDREIKGADLSIMMVYPGPDSLFDKSKKRNQFAIVGGTGIVGMRDTNTMPYFVSGVHYPDLMVYDSRLPMIGSKAVRVAGLFGNDWSVENGEFDWRD
ncbi:MAG TPA: prolyl oligopeptidase family serine peptidase, partial [Fimbriimonadaceae bacterium]|nr:prolyl oligopeptidase family serine peptidase [Fimbriimonadaceae bacterium]